MEKEYVNVTIKKGQWVRITVEGIENFPAEFPYHQFVEVVAENIKRQCANDYYKSLGPVQVLGEPVAVGMNLAQANLLNRSNY